MITPSSLVSPVDQRYYINTVSVETLTINFDFTMDPHRTSGGCANTDTFPNDLAARPGEFNYYREYSVTVNNGAKPSWMIWSYDDQDGAPSIQIITVNTNLAGIYTVVV